MNTSGDAAEQVVRLSLEGMEVAAKITGSAAKEVAALLYAALKNRDKNKIKGRQRLTSMLRSGKELTIFTVKNKDMARFVADAKRYGVVYCVLREAKDNPHGVSEIMVRAEDAAKINRVNLARRKFLKPWQEYTMNDRVQWCVAAVPAPSWAAKVFPGIPVEEAMEKLWALIFDVCRVSTGDPVSAWKAHVAEGRRHRDQLNAWNLDHIHMTSSNGTDLTVGLADDATWEGASSKAENGTDFIANVPTEEVFCAPHRERVNGIVYGTKPYVYNGQLIEGWHVTFKDGKVVEHGAEKNASLLAELLSTDENACRIGEIALVPASSPINQSGVLFYNTLFDENAACHIAFGAGYPTNIKGGSKMNRTELLAKGLNDSAIHEDVMIGAADTHVTGITKRGEEVTIFENGEWAF